MLALFYTELYSENFISFHFGIARTVNYIIWNKSKMVLNSTKNKKQIPLSYIHPLIYMYNIQILRSVLH